MQKALILLALISVASATRNPFGIVEGIVDCGSAGRLGDVQVTDCTQTPCTFVPDTTYDVSIRFVSSQTSSQLALYIYIVDLPIPIVELPISGEIEAGIEYDLAFKLPVSQEVAGLSFDIQFFIFNTQNSRIEVCAEAPVKVTN